MAVMIVFDLEMPGHYHKNFEDIHFAGNGKSGKNT
jgi:hypothetical protein